MAFKRGQATGFVIIGIVIVALVLLFLYLRGSLIFGPVTPKTLEGRMQSVRDHIGSCLQDVGDEPLRRIGLQGGHLKTPEGTFRLQEDIPISILCYNIKGKTQCQNRMLTKAEMQNEIAEAMKLGLAQCLDLGQFKRGVDLAVGKQDLFVDIGGSIVTATLKQMITLKKDQLTVKEDTFSYNFDYPLGRLYEVSQDIIDVETEFGEFDQLSYMLAHKGEYLIEKKKPYPDKLYILRTKDSDYIFQFFIQDEPG